MAGPPVRHGGAPGLRLAAGSWRAIRWFACPWLTSCAACSAWHRPVRPRANPRQGAGDALLADPWAASSAGEPAAEPAPPPAACPSCAVILDPPPSRDRRCPRCRQKIVVRHVEGRLVAAHRGGPAGLRRGARARDPRALLDRGAAALARAGQERRGPGDPAGAADRGADLGGGRGRLADAVPPGGRGSGAQGSIREALGRRRLAAPQAGRRAVRRRRLARATPRRDRRPSSRGHGRPPAITGHGRAGCRARRFRVLSRVLRGLGEGVPDRG